MYVGKFNLSFCSCSAEHSCRFLNKAKRKVKKQKKWRKLNRWVQCQERALLNLETTLGSSFSIADWSVRVLCKGRWKDEGWGWWRRRTSQPFSPFLFQCFFSIFFVAVERSAAWVWTRGFKARILWIDGEREIVKVR